MHWQYSSITTLHTCSTKLYQHDWLLILSQDHTVHNAALIPCHIGSLPPLHLSPSNSGNSSLGNKSIENRTAKEEFHREYGFFFSGMDLFQLHEWKSYAKLDALCFPFYRGKEPVLHMKCDLVTNERYGSEAHIAPLCNIWNMNTYRRIAGQLDSGASPWGSPRRRICREGTGKTQKAGEQSIKTGNRTGVPTMTSASVRNSAGRSKQLLQKHPCPKQSKIGTSKRDGEGSLRWFSFLV